jgi:hypothetical protein
VLYELADPLGILYVGLLTRNVLHMPGVQQPALEVLFEHVVDRLPVRPRGLHPNQLDLEGGQPVPKPQEPSCRGVELADLLVRLLVLLLSGADPHARGDRGFMHVESGTPLNDPFQAPLPSLGMRFPARRRREEPLVPKNLVFVL